MSRSLVPELHDVLKLTVLRHNFADFDRFQGRAPDTPTWRGVLQHHCDDKFPAYPSDRDTFLLHVADGLAANFSRHPQAIRHDIAWTVYRLWNPESAPTDQRMSNDADIIAMLQYLGTDPNFEDFYRRYPSIFQSRSEDAHPGMNVTSLETHVRLVGRFYRFLQGSRHLTVTEEEVHDAAKQGLAAIINLRNEKLREWRLYLYRCHLGIVPNPFRARDLSVFVLLDEFLAEVRSEFGDNVLFASSEEMLLCSDSPEILGAVRSLAAPRAISLDIRTRRTEHLLKGSLTVEVDKAGRQWRREDLAPPPPIIEPPLCELCQSQPATKVWPRDYIAGQGPESQEIQQGTDYLCEICFLVRSRPSKLKKLAYWDEWEQGELIWVQIGLDFDHLCETLRKLYWDYLRGLDPATPEEKAEIRLSLLGEFQADYEHYLSHFRMEMLEKFGEGRTETLLPSLFCVKADTGQDVLQVLRVHLACVKRFFAAFLSDRGCPLRLSLALAGVGYPFFEVWRLWQQQQSEVEVLALGHGGLRLAMRGLEKFLQLADFPFRRSALQALAEISRISQQLAELRFRAKADRVERETFEHLGEFLPLGLDFEGILALAKLIGS